ncbi:trypco2 family protein [Streptomyces sp. NPDC049099]|uniref:trypco2 family protein n=1 Tax=Streptomyces sp. NPDC049099 TaxID=3155768 RepID=UPI00343C71B5
MVELSERNRQLRAEPVTAMAEGEGEDLRFAPGPVERELPVCVQRDAVAHGKVTYRVLEAGAEAEVISGLSDAEER